MFEWTLGYDPFREVVALRRQMDRLFDDFLLDDRAKRSRGPSGWPAVNVIDTPTALIYEAELPGVKLDDIDVEVTASSFTLTGERKPDVPDGYAVHRQERRPIKFARTFTLPTEINPEQVKAVFRHGVLTVTLEKSPASRPRSITVQAG
ncbi:MAG: Hsp20/alpha crystallin family protein [Myxococcales bacterium]|nr:Hsp20/alpha crystallin family protein [Myxococcales bacterium]